jgi:protein-tyrosine phosphatase
VALTAEVERGQVKCHPYWKPGDYGPFKVKVLGEKRVFMDSKSNGSPLGSRDASLERSPSPGSKAATGEPRPASEESPFIMVRHFALLHSSYPFQPIREISQLQYSYWPDFGTTSQPTHLLKLVEQCNKITRKNSGLNLNIDDAEPPGQRPVLVHCSAGCGRTGTFCTVDSVLDTLKQQRQQQNQSDDAVDIIAKTVEDFRKQRPSMIQNLSQFVLCYESVLEWMVARTKATGGS